MPVRLLDMCIGVGVHALKERVRIEVDTDISMEGT